MFPLPVSLGRAVPSAKGQLFERRGLVPELASAVPEEEEEPSTVGLRRGNAAEGFGDVPVVFCNN